MTRKTTLYLQDILEHMRLAERFVEGRFCGVWK
jgi:uncharacterized protein with HEPN domain